VEVGGSGGYGRMGTCGSPGEPANERRSSGGGERSPSCGWRETAQQMDAIDGVGHR
jgi:hypothetical protein